MKINLSSDEVNMLVQRYLLESGYVHTAYAFSAEASLSMNPLWNSYCESLPPNALISFLQKAMLFIYIEYHTDEDTGESIRCDEPFSFFRKHECWFKTTAEPRVRGGSFAAAACEKDMKGVSLLNADSLQMENSLHTDTISMSPPSPIIAPAAKKMAIHNEVEPTVPKSIPVISTTKEIEDTLNELQLETEKINDLSKLQESNFLLTYLQRHRGDYYIHGYPTAASRCFAPVTPLTLSTNNSLTSEMQVSLQNEVFSEITFSPNVLPPIKGDSIFEWNPKVPHLLLAVFSKGPARLFNFPFLHKSYNAPTNHNFGDFSKFYQCILLANISNNTYHYSNNSISNDSHNALENSSNVLDKNALKSNVPKNENIYENNNNNIWNENKNGASTCLAWSIDGEMCAIGYENGGIQVYRIGGRDIDMIWSESNLSRFFPESPAKSENSFVSESGESIEGNKANENSLVSISFSPCGKYISLGLCTSALLVYELIHNKNNQITLNLVNKFLNSNKSAIFNMCWNKNDTLCIADTDGAVRTMTNSSVSQLLPACEMKPHVLTESASVSYDIHFENILIFRGKELYLKTISNSNINNIMCKNNPIVNAQFCGHIYPQYVYSAWTDGNIYIYDILQGKNMHQVHLDISITAAATNIQGNILAIADGEKNIKFFHLPELIELCNISVHSLIAHICWSGDSSRLACTEYDGTGTLVIEWKQCYDFISMK